MKNIIHAVCFLAFLTLAAIACRHQDLSIQPDNPGGAGTGTGTGAGGTGGSTGTTDTALCFERDILPVFQANCSVRGCHSGQDADSRKGDFVFSSYETIIAKEFAKGDPSRTKLFEAITRAGKIAGGDNDDDDDKDDDDDDHGGDNDDDDPRMPLNDTALTDYQIGLIYRWIKDGAPNSNGCVKAVGGSGCDSSKFTFSGTIQPMLNTYCKSCHTTGSASKGVPLDNYNGVKAVADDGRLIGVIKRLPGYPAMPQGGSKLSDCNVMLIERWIAAGTLND
jgi:hypothetical protein